MSYLSQVPSHGTATPGTALLVLHAPRATRVTRPAQPARIRILTSVRVTRGTAVWHVSLDGYRQADVQTLKFKATDEDSDQKSLLTGKLVTSK